MSKFDAVFVGLTILDIAGRPVAAIPPGGNVAFIEQIRLNPAGTAAGANINAAKLGIRTAAVACLGDDEKGDLIQSSYRRLGIDLSLLQFSPRRETSATILPIRPNGERPALHYRGASDDLFVSEAQFDAVLDCRYLHHGGSGLLAAMDGGQSALLLAAAKARGIVTSFDLIAPGPDTLALLRPLLPFVDWFMPSLEEAAAISGLSDAGAIAAFFVDLGAANCIFKDGERGSWLFQSGQPGQRIPAWQVAVQDTTGCGDGYCGGFIAALARGLEPPAACRVASAVAALVATGLGSDAGVVDWDHTEAFMAETPLLG